MTEITAPDRNLAMELVRVTEAAALAASRWMGRGDKNGADGAAVDAMRLMRGGLPLCLALLLLILWLGPAAGALEWAAWCVACTFVTVSQPAVGAAFPAALAGRALSAFNLVIFAGVFSIQWGVGLLVDAAASLGAGDVAAFRAAFGVFAACSLASYLWLLREPPRVADNPTTLRRPSSSH